MSAGKSEGAVGDACAAARLPGLLQLGRHLPLLAQLVAATSVPLYRSPPPPGGVSPLQFMILVPFSFNRLSLQLTHQMVQGSS